MNEVWSFEKECKINGEKTYIEHLNKRIENLSKVMKKGDHAPDTDEFRMVYWGCSCAMEDVNATKCDECYNINVVRDIMKDELKALKKIKKKLEQVNIKPASK